MRAGPRASGGFARGKRWFPGVGHFSPNGKVRHRAWRTKGNRKASKPAEKRPNVVPHRFQVPVLPETKNWERPGQPSWFRAPRRHSHRHADAHGRKGTETAPPLLARLAAGMRARQRRSIPFARRSARMLTRQAERSTASRVILIPQGIEPCPAKPSPKPARRQRDISQYESKKQKGRFRMCRTLLPLLHRPAAIPRVLDPYPANHAGCYYIPRGSAAGSLRNPGNNSTSDRRLISHNPLFPHEATAAARRAFFPPHETPAPVRRQAAFRMPAHAPKRTAKLPYRR